MESIILQLLLLFVSLTSAAYLKRNDNGKCLVDVITVVDGSDSIIDADFVKLQEALVELAKTLDLGDGSRRMGAVVYSSGVADSTPLTTNFEVLKSEINSFPHPKMGTSTHDGIKKMIEMFKTDGRKPVPQIGIVVTDGRSIKPSLTLAAAKEARDDGVRIIAVGIGHGINRTELEGMASNKGDVKMLTNFSELKALLKTLSLNYCVVDGNWTEWSDPTPSQCSVTCETGTRTLTYTRTCTNPAPENGGKPCQGPGEKTETEPCTVERGCPLDGHWTRWSDPTPSQCSVTCGNGTRTLTYNRTCTNPAPENGGKHCEGQHKKTETEFCKVEEKCPPDNPCSRCRFVNGVGYTAHWSNCLYFLQCVNHGKSYHIIKCPRGKSWHEGHLTCSASHSGCSTEVLEEPWDEPVPVVPVCDGTKTQLPGNSNAYKQNVPNIGWVTRQCSPGTFFNTSNCHCDHGGPALARDCRPEVYIPFNGNTKDESGKHTHIHNVKNLVTTTVASQGLFVKNSVLRINRFSNMDFGSTVDINFLMRRGSRQNGNQAIVSNADCGAKGSIYVIMRKDGNVEFRVLSSTGVGHTLKLPYTEASDGFTEVTLVVADGKMVARVNTKQTSKKFDGSIERSHCALQLGEGTGYESYTGFLDDFKLFICKR